MVIRQAYQNCLTGARRRRFFGKKHLIRPILSVGQNMQSFLCTVCWKPVFPCNWRRHLWALVEWTLFRPASAKRRCPCGS